MHTHQRLWALAVVLGVGLAAGFVAGEAAGEEPDAGSDAPALDMPSWNALKQRFLHAHEQVSRESRRVVATVAAVRAPAAARIEAAEILKKLYPDSLHRAALSSLDSTIPVLLSGDGRARGPRRPSRDLLASNPEVTPMLLRETARREPNEVFAEDVATILRALWPDDVALGVVAAWSEAERKHSGRVPPGLVLLAERLKVE